MKVSVNCRKLEEVGNKMLANKDLLDNYINSCLDGMRLIENGWKGQDATYSISKINNYLNNLKNISTAYENLGNFMKYASKEYYNKDNSFNDKFIKERQEYESEYGNV